MQDLTYELKNALRELQEAHDILSDIRSIASEFVQNSSEDVEWEDIQFLTQELDEQLRRAEERLKRILYNDES